VPKWHLDEVFIKINGTIHYLWRAVDQHGNMLDILVTSRRHAKALPGSSVNCSPACRTCRGC
jgi:transposase-like protein